MDIEKFKQAEAVQNQLDILKSMTDAIKPLLDVEEAETTVKIFHKDIFVVETSDVSVVQNFCEWFMSSVWRSSCRIT